MLEATRFFVSKNISAYAIFNDQSFNDMLTNIISFEQLGPRQYRHQTTICPNQLPPTKSIISQYATGNDHARVPNFHLQKMYSCYYNHPDRIIQVYRLYISFLLLHCFGQTKCAILENCVPFVPYMINGSNK